MTPEKNPSQIGWSIHFPPYEAIKSPSKTPIFVVSPTQHFNFPLKILLVTYCREIPVKSKSVAKSQLDPPLLPSLLDDFNECFIPNSWLLNPYLWNQSGHHHFNIHIQRIPNYFMQNNLNVKFWCLNPSETMAKRGTCTYIIYHHIIHIFETIYPLVKTNSLLFFKYGQKKNSGDLP